MVEILKLMLGQDFEDEIFGNVLFVFVCVVFFLDHEVQTHIMTSPLSLSLVYRTWLDKQIFSEYLSFFFAS